MNRWHVAYEQNRTASIFGRKAAASALCSMATMVALVVAVLVGVLALSAPPAAAQGTAQEAVRKPADFNGDGYADLAIGAPGEDYWFSLLTGSAHILDAGVVHVVFGSSGGLAYGRNQLLSRASESPYSLYHPANYAGFGRALTWGDFNRDGFDDLAVGVPGDRNYQGSVDIYYGSVNGLPYRAGQRIAQSQMPGAPPPSAHSEFGKALAAGDVNQDGYADLVISQFYGGSGRGAAYVIPGASPALNPASAQMLNYFTIYGPSSMAFGDFNGDGHADLAMGLPHEYTYGIHHAGAVLVAFGTPYGLDSTPQVWSQNSPGIPGICEAFDCFGYSRRVITTRQ